MKQENLDFFEKHLKEEREKIFEELETRKKDDFSATLKDSTGEHSSYSFHMADQGTDSQEREKSFLFASRAGQYLDNINDAITRIKEGQFGICMQCGEDIDIERLKAVPIAKQCIKCKTSRK